MNYTLPADLTNHVHKPSLLREVGVALAGAVGLASVFFVLYALMIGVMV